MERVKPLLVSRRSESSELAETIDTRQSSSGYLRALKFELARERLRPLTWARPASVTRGPTGIVW